MNSKNLSKLVKNLVLASAILSLNVNLVRAEDSNIHEDLTVIANKNTLNITENENITLENDETIVNKNIEIEDISTHQDSTNAIAEDVIIEENAPNISVVQNDKNLHVQIKENDNTLFKQEALKLGQAACFFKTQGEDPYFTVVRPDIDENYIYKCGCIDPLTGNARHIKNTDDLESIYVIEQLINGFSGNYRYKMKYQGERKSYIGKFLESCISEEKYPGKILIDEYKKNIPMFWTLKTTDELRSILTYMINNFEEEEFKVNQKTLLVLKIDADPELKTLDETDKQILNAYFKLFPLTDKDVKEFFENSKKIILEGNSYMHDPKYVGETVGQSVLRQTEKFYKDFKGKDIAIIIGCLITYKLIDTLLENEIKGIKESVHSKFKDKTGSSTIVGAITNWFNDKIPSSSS